MGSRGGGACGNTLVLEDLFPPNKKTKPEPFGALAGRKGLRIDTTLGAEVRARFVQETLGALDVRAGPGAVAALAESESDLGAIANDLEKLALAGKKITLVDLERGETRGRGSEGLGVRGSAGRRPNRRGA